MGYHGSDIVAQSSQGSINVQNRDSVSDMLEKRLTYLGSRFECAIAQGLGFLSLALLSHHRVMVCACWDNHGSITVSTVHTLVEHNVLRVVLSKAKGKREQNVKNRVHRLLQMKQKWPKS